MKKSPPKQGGTVSSTLRIAKAPFDAQTADVLFVSSDGVQFYVIKAILAMASPLFSDTFPLTQPPMASSSGSLRNAFEVPEDSSTLDHLLRLCYPISDPEITDVRTAGQVLEAALKYQMSEATTLSTKILRTFVHSHPLDVYAIACTLGLEPEAKMAASAWRSSRMFTEDGPFNMTVAGAGYIPAMAKIRAGSYFRLMQFGRGGQDAEQSFCAPTRGSPLLPIGTSAPSPTFVASSLVAPRELYRDGADVILRSSDGVDFPAHTLILRAASAEGLFRISDSEVRTHGQIPIIPVDTSSFILAPLLKLCYPFYGGQRYAENLLTTCAIVRVAIKYQMRQAVTYLRDELTSLIPTNPLAVFFLAIELGWTATAQECCKHVVALDIESTYVPEMENAYAEDYYKLLQYRHECEELAFRVVAKHAPLIPHRSSSVQLALREALHSSVGALSLVIVDQELRKPSQWSSSYGGGSPITRSLDTPSLLIDSARFRAELQASVSAVSHTLAQRSYRCRADVRDQ